ncbi:MAG: ATP-dependent zinc metalloprotease FtsH [Acidimicrobiaceae bacterium]
MSVSRVLRNVLVWVGILVSLVMVGILMQKGERVVQELTYSEYKLAIEKGKVSRATVYKTQLNDFEFRGELKGPFVVYRSHVPEGKLTLNKGDFFETKLGVVDSQTEQYWVSNGITWKYESGDTPWWMSIVQFLPWVLLFVAFIFVKRRMQSGGPGGKNIFSFGKSRARLLNDANGRVTFTEVAGAEEAKEELKEIVEFLRDPGRFTRLGGKIPRGVLLLGPPGTGKTLLARAVAGEAGVPFFTISGADFVEMFVGVGASRVRDLFQQARKMGKAIIFIDEIDSIGRKRGAGLGGGHDEREQTLNQMLAEMDGFETTEGIVILAATNRPDILDPALLRPGRFDRQIIVPLPEFDERLAILKVHSRDKRMGTDVDLDTMAKATPGMSGADLANLVNEAALFAVRRGSAHIERIDFENARDRVVMGARRESLVLSAEEKRATAIHEGGHAILATVLPHSDPLHKVTILPRGMALGVTWTLPEERHTYSREFFEDLICKAMGGRVAEKIVFGHLNSGAANDLEQATSIARRMVREWGMSDKVGPMAWNGQQQVFLGEDLMTSGREYSDSTAKMLDDEISRILHEQEQRAHELLVKHRKGLELVAEKLLEDETIDGATVGRLVQEALETPTPTEA